MTQVPQGGTMTVTYDGDITVQNRTTYPAIANECVKYVRGRMADRFPWMADANLNILFFDYRPNVVRPMVTGLRIVRPAVPETAVQEEALDA